jgi:hypothetical protein
LQYPYLVITTDPVVEWVTGRMDARFGNLNARPLASFQIVIVPCGITVNKSGPIRPGSEITAITTVLEVNENTGN